MMSVYKQDFLIEYTNEELANEIKRVSKLVTVGPLTQKEFKKFARVSVSTISRRFGGWRESLRAANLEHRYSGKTVTS
jgi:Homing endonuclease associated repeat